ncbi:hypothetical protein AKJ09_08664 [Labilithrix luteola]|uniref:Uncharacterized protein n=1 Tax=Labilithrix luteola TaxID=1391654 RepID=A0A0K1Q863_9BACT|nr:hypothetical protein AKJ09_08664 [Labilithrix luteola]
MAWLVELDAGAAPGWGSELPTEEGGALVAPPQAAKKPIDAQASAVRRTGYMSSGSVGPGLARCQSVVSFCNRDGLQ